MKAVLRYNIESNKFTYMKLMYIYFLSTRPKSSHRPTSVPPRQQRMNPSAPERSASHGRYDTRSPPPRKYHQNPREGPSQRARSQYQDPRERRPGSTSTNYGQVPRQSPRDGPGRNGPSRHYPNNSPYGREEILF